MHVPLIVWSVLGNLLRNAVFTILSDVIDLHAACYNGHKEVVKYLVERAHCDTSEWCMSVTLTLFWLSLSLYGSSQNKVSVLFV